MKLRFSFSVAALLFAFGAAYAQSSVGIGTGSPNQKAVLELIAINGNQGFLAPRLTSPQRAAFATGLTAADNGMLVFDSDEGKFYVWYNAAWNPMGIAQLIAGSGISVNGQTITNTGDTNAADDITITTASAGDVLGRFDSLVVTRLRRLPLDSVAPAVGHSLVWNGQVWKFQPTSASSQTVVPNTNLLATNTQAALEELQVEILSITTGPNSVGSGEIIDGAITNADINATAAIAGSKVSPNFGVQNVVTTGTVTAASFVGSGSGLTGVTATPGVNTVGGGEIVDGAITNADINATAAIAGSKINPDFGAQNVITTGTVTAASFVGNGSALTGVTATPGVNTVGSGEIIDGAITNADINATAAIAGSKINPDFGAQNVVTTGTVTAASFVGDGSGLLGVTATPGANTVGSGEIIDGAITNADINATAAIAGSKVNPDFGAQNVVTTGSVTAASFVGNGSGLLGVTATPGANTVGSGEIIDGAITNADINAAAAIGWAKIDKTGAVLSDITNDEGYITIEGDPVWTFDRATLGSAGTINTVSNLVDWTQLKGVPADFSDGIDNGFTDLNAFTTDELNEGATNLYHTTPRVMGVINATSVDALSDVNTGGASTGQVLKFNGSQWAPAADAGLATVTTADIVNDNVTLTKLENGTGSEVLTTDISGNPQYELKSALNVGSATTLSSTLPVTLGGTGATSVVDARTNLGLGTAATLNAGTAPNNLVQLNGTSQLPAVDGSLLNNVAAVSATNFTGALGGDVMGNQAATVVSQVGGQTAGNIASAVTTVTAATATNLAGTLVLRDGSGDFSAGNITATSFVGDGAALTGLDPNAMNDLEVNITDNFVSLGGGAGTTVASGGTAGPSNTFLGANTGQNAAIGGTANTFVGANSGLDNTSGSGNVFVGNAVGTGGTSLVANLTGSDLTLIGAGADVGLNGLVNATAIGAGAVVDQDNSLVLGDNLVNVGIKTTTPSSDLQINDDLHIYHFDNGSTVEGEFFSENLHPVGTDIRFSKTGPATAMYHTAGEMRFLVGASQTAGTSAFGVGVVSDAMTIQNTGDVRFWNGIQVGNVSGLPDPGAIRYDVGVFQGYNGSGWVDFGGLNFPVSESVNVGSSSFQIVNQGTGGVAYFGSDNIAATNDAVAIQNNSEETASAGIGLIHSGLGRGIELTLSNVSNAEYGIHATTTGTGTVGYFGIANASSIGTAVEGITNGSGTAVRAQNTGNGIAARVTSSNPSNASVAFVAEHDGVASVALFQNTANATQPAVSINNNGSSSALDIQSGGNTTRFGQNANFGGQVSIGHFTPTVSLDIAGTDAVRLPVGSDGQRPGSPLAGMIRYNSAFSQYEGYDGVIWRNLSAAGIDGNIAQDITFNGNADRQLIVNQAPSGIGRNLSINAGNAAIGGAGNGGELFLNAGLGDGLGNPGNVNISGNRIFASQMEVTGASSGTSASMFSVRNSILTNLIDVSSNGNMGVGSVAASAQLEVVNNGLGTHPGGIFTVFNNGKTVSHLTVSNAGNVGIGTTSPATRLHVNGGDVQIDNLAGGGVRYVTVGLTGVLTSGPFQNGDPLVGVSPITGRIPYFLSANSLDESVIEANGTNVSVGAAINANYIFQVSQTTAFPAVYGVNNGVGGSGVWGYSVNAGGEAGVRGVAVGAGSGVKGSNSGAGYGGQFSNSSTGAGLFVENTSTGPAAVFATGNVGIGTNNPAQKLDVNGTTRSSDFTFTAPVTKFASLSSYVFKQMQSQTSASRFATPNAVTPYHYFNGTNNVFGYADAALNLPDGAIITELRAWLWDNDNTAPVRVNILRVENGIWSTQSVAEVESLAATALASVQELFTTTIFSGTIDNSSNAYFVRFTGFEDNTQNTRLYQVRVAYTMSKPY